MCIPLLLLFKCLLVSTVFSSSKDEAKSQLDAEDASALRDANVLSKFNCDFGSDLGINLCQWTIPEFTHPIIRWKAGQGTYSHWSGGPPIDHTHKNSSGGFAYFETSYKQPEPSATSGRAFTLNWKTLVDMTREFSRNITKQAEPIVETRIQPLLYKISGIRDRIENRIHGTRIVTNVQNMYQHMIRDLNAPCKASLVSPTIPPTKPQGICLQFYYSVAGLSADKLSLTIVEKHSARSRLLWQSKFDSQEEWIKMEVLYAHPSEHQLIIDGFAKNRSDLEREYRGYIAIDDIAFLPKASSNTACHGHCTFDGGFCDWYNLEYTDNFDWKLAKGSHSLYTGPSQDYNSFAKDLPPGNFIYIESQHPLRFSDRAVLVSPHFAPTSTAKGFCMKFAYHMFGDGIGTLNVVMQTKQVGDQVLWTVSGEQGNTWLIGQVPIYSDFPFRLMLEATVGPTPLGNIAVDAISFWEEFCPTNPSFASSRVGDCTFEENLCNWFNKQTEDDFDWVRVPMTPMTSFDKRNYAQEEVSKGMNATNVVNSYFLTLNGDMLRPDKAGLSAHLESPVFPAHTLQCMTFHYFMYQNVSRDSFAPALGGIRVHLTWTDRFNETHEKFLWKLNNHQSNKWRRARIPLGLRSEYDRRYRAPEYPYKVVFKGVWANSDNGLIGIDDISFATGECDLVPKYATVELAECSFDRTTCGWTDYVVKNSENADSVWTPFKLVVPSTVTESTFFIKDHTFNTLGYMASTSVPSGVVQKSVLLSPILSSRSDPMESNSTEKCMGFWFTSFPSKDNMPSKKSLSVFQAVLMPRLGVVDAKSLLLWKVQDDSIPVNSWQYGQVSFHSELRYRILFKTEATDGGFAIDDITFYDGSCQTRPFMASVAQPSVQF